MNFTKTIIPILTALSLLLVIFPTSANSQTEIPPNTGTIWTDLVNSSQTILIAAITGFVGAAISYIYNNKKAEQDSRRSYEYEARKRLYAECEPILFQIIQFSDNAFKLIKWLANETRKGKFVSNQENRLFIGNTYMMRSTIYRFLAPLAAFRILQSTLTTVDLRLDSKISLQYMLIKKYMKQLPETMIWPSLVLNLITNRSILKNGLTKGRKNHRNLESRVLTLAD